MGGVALDIECRRGRVASRHGALELSAELSGEGLTLGPELRIRHRFGQLAHVFVPHLTPNEGMVAGDAVFRSPAVILATRNQVVAFIPDLDDVRSARGYRVWSDYDHVRGCVVFGAGAYRREGHVFYVREEIPCSGQSVRLRVHVLASTRAPDCANSYRMVGRFLWSRWGRPGHEASPLPSFDAWTRWVTRWAFEPEGWEETVWQSFELEGRPAGAPVFIVDVRRHPAVPARERRWREAPSIWNQAWFSTQRCANGLLRHARHRASEPLAERARRMTELALAAPMTDGLFPAVLLADSPTGNGTSGEGAEPRWERARWTSSDRRPPSTSQAACHVVDAAITCQMLLEWYELTGEPRALDRVRAFADRLVRLQRPSGAFPGWVEPNGGVSVELREGPETAVGVTLLFEVCRALGPRADWMRAGRAGARFLESVIDESRWEDFETYYSCAPWGAPSLVGRRVPRNGVFKQNTLSMAWCAEAMLSVWRATGSRRHLDHAIRCASELALYQSVWNPPWLPAPAHGGFGVMNADAEWNDARQSLFAPLLFELYRASGDIEWFERGASALRASFSMMYCPENVGLKAAYERCFPFFGKESYGFMMENQGHGADDAIGDFTIFTWGNGSALAAVASVLDRVGHVYVDVERRRVLSLDGVVARDSSGVVSLQDPLGRAALRVVRSDGTRETVTLCEGVGSVAFDPRSRTE